MEEIIEEVKQERVRQDEKWGGPEHDDAHNSTDWLDMIDEKAIFHSHRHVRESLIMIAALAIAGIESIDRRNGKGDSK